MRSLRNSRGALLLGLLVLMGCQHEKPSPVFSGCAMTIPYRVVVARSLSMQQHAEISELIAGAFDMIDRSCNHWNPRSEIAYFNRCKAYERVAISQPLMRLIALVDHLYRQTEGRFDPTVGTLVQLWKRALKTGCLPDNALCSQAQQTIGWQKIHHEDSFLWKEEDAIALDLCAIAKGYGVDLIAEALDRAGYNDYCIDWGGEIRTSGHSERGGLWNIAIAGSDLVLSGTLALATSGNYLQHWQIEGVHYTHILNPLSGIPLTLHEQAVASVTVASSSCAYSDALATALMVFANAEDALQWSQALVVEANPPVHIWIGKLGSNN